MLFDAMTVMCEEHGEYDVRTADACDAVAVYSFVIAGYPGQVQVLRVPGEYR